MDPKIVCSCKSKVSLTELIQFRPVNPFGKESGGRISFGPDYDQTHLNLYVGVCQRVSKLE